MDQGRGFCLKETLVPRMYRFGLLTIVLGIFTFILDIFYCIYAIRISRNLVELRPFVVTRDFFKGREMTHVFPAPPGGCPHDYKYSVKGRRLYWMLVGCLGVLSVLLFLTGIKLKVTAGKLTGNLDVSPKSVTSSKKWFCVNIFLCLLFIITFFSLGPIVKYIDWNHIVC